MKIQKIVLNKERNVNLTCFIQSVGGEFGIKKRPAILILPGGGYSMCSDREAEPVAGAYIQAGFQVFVLRYSVGDHKAWPNPLNDYEQAMSLIKENEDRWHVQTDKIAVIGFSAGGHLAACAATIAEHRPNAAILGYAAITKETADMCQPGMPYPAEHVDENTCPCFLFATRNDNIVPISNTLEFEIALVACKTQFESHIYAWGPHGFSTGETYLNGAGLCSRAAHWVRDSIEWLWDIFGVFTNEGFSAPICPGKVNGDMEANLSVDCTIGHLRNQPEPAQQFLTNVFDGIKAAAGERSVSEESLLFMLREMRLRDLMIMLKTPQETIDQLDAALKPVPNIR